MPKPGNQKNAAHKYHLSPQIAFWAKISCLTQGANLQATITTIIYSGMTQIIDPAHKDLLFREF